MGIHNEAHLSNSEMGIEVSISFPLVIIPPHQHPLTSTTPPSFSSFYLSSPFIFCL